MRKFVKTELQLVLVLKNGKCANAIKLCHTIREHFIRFGDVLEH